jgi:hypothetical protein
MTDVKHTPGPWLHVKGERLSHDAEGWTEWAVVPAIVSLATGEAVVKDAEDICPHNARLIASAPDLLEALILALPYVEDASDSASPADQEIIRAAIARATGEAA